MFKILPVSIILPLSTLINKSIEQSLSKTVGLPVSELYAYYPLKSILIGYFGCGASKLLKSLPLLVL